jgi:hypothetical protein
MAMLAGGFLCQVSSSMGTSLLVSTYRMFLCCTMHCYSDAPAKKVNVDRGGYGTRVVICKASM